MFADTKVQRVVVGGVFLATLGSVYTAWAEQPSLPDLAANFYTDLIILVALFQIALALGAPWGAYTLAGRWDGRLPGKVRIIPLLSVVMLSFMAAAILVRRGFIPVEWPPVLYWIAIALTGLTFIANIATPSRPERNTWGPVTALMLTSGLMAGLL